MEDIAMSSGMDPDKMSGAERLDEVAMLLTLAMMRLWLKRRKKREISKRNSLGKPPETRPPVTAG
jgi:hypothetical protein